MSKFIGKMALQKNFSGKGRGKQKPPRIIFININPAIIHFEKAMEFLSDGDFKNAKLNAWRIGEIGPLCACMRKIVLEEAKTDFKSAVDTLDKLKIYMRNWRWQDLEKALCYNLVANTEFLIGIDNDKVLETIAFAYQVVNESEGKNKHLNTALCLIDSALTLNAIETNGLGLKKKMTQKALEKALEIVVGHLLGKTKMGEHEVAVYVCRDIAFFSHKYEIGLDLASSALEKAQAFAEKIRNPWVRLQILREIKQDRGRYSRGDPELRNIPPDQYNGMLN